MEILNSILAILASIISIIMAIIAYNEKQQCIKIKNEINIHYKKIESNDNYNINSIGTFDNKKSIK